MAQGVPAAAVGGAAEPASNEPRLKVFIASVHGKENVLPVVAWRSRRVNPRMFRSSTAPWLLPAAVRFVRSRFAVPGARSGPHDTPLSYQQGVFFPSKAPTTTLVAPLSQ